MEWLRKACLCWSVTVLPGAVCVCVQSVSCVCVCLCVCPDWWELLVSWSGAHRWGNWPLGTWSFSEPQSLAVAELGPRPGIFGAWTCALWQNVLFGLIVKKMVSNRCNEEISNIQSFQATEWDLIKPAVNHFKRKQNLILASAVETAYFKKWEWVKIKLD